MVVCSRSLQARQWCRPPARFDASWCPAQSGAVPGCSSRLTGGSAREGSIRRALGARDQVRRLAHPGAPASGTACHRDRRNPSVTAKPMKIATYNVNGVNGRLVLLRWLKEAQPDIVCVQEFHEGIPLADIRKAECGAIAADEGLEWCRDPFTRHRPVETPSGLRGSDPEDLRRLYRGGCRRANHRVPYLPNLEEIPHQDRNSTTSSLVRVQSMARRSWRAITT